MFIRFLGGAWLYPSRCITAICAALLWLISAATPVHAAGSNTTTTLVSAPLGSVTFGQQFTLTATVAPSAVSGKVTFYDGTTILGVAAVTSGTAVLTTIGLEAGSSFLVAFYAGDLSYAPSTSPRLQITVNPKPGSGFAAAGGSPFAAGRFPQSVAAGDFNGDGKVDLAIPNSVSNDVTILLGDGMGGFTVASGSPFVVGNTPSSIAVGDFNGDGKPDLAIATTNDVSVLLGNGNGGFTPALGSPFAMGSLPSSIAVGDMNGDGKADLIIVSAFANILTVMLGDGSVGFTVPTMMGRLSTGRAPVSAAIGDFNGDGKADLALANELDNNVTVLLGFLNLGFTTAVGSPFAVGNYPSAVAVGDFNRDGKADLAVANIHDNNVSILLGNGTGGFIAASGSPFAVGNGPASISVGDFNGDGKADLATANRYGNDVTVLLGNGMGAFTAGEGSPFAVGTNPVGLTTGDFNRDGRADLAVINYGSNDVTVLLAGPPVARPPSVSPSSGSDSAQAFTFTYTDLGGFQNMAGSQIVINSTLTGVNSCYILFGRGNNTISLADDAGNPGPTNSVGFPGVLQNSQCSILSSVSSQSGLGNTETLTVYVVFKPRFAGLKNVYVNSNNNAGVSAGFQQVGTFTATVNTQPIASNSVVPSSGFGPAQSFTFNYSDPNGYEDLAGSQVVFNTALNGVSACYVLFGRGTNQISLADDTGNNLTTAPLGAETVLQNSQCMVFAANSYQSGSGTNLSLNLFVAFKAGFAGAKSIFSGTNDNAGTRSLFAQLGTWTVPATVPLASAVNVTPARATGPSQALTFAFFDPFGSENIFNGQAVVNSTLTAVNSCSIQFVRLSGQIRLAGDDGNAVTTGTLGQSTLLQNSQCIVNLASSYKSASGNYLTLTLFITMKTAGMKNVYAQLGTGTQTSGSGAVGTWDVSTPATLLPVAEAPSTGAGGAVTYQFFTFTFSDPNGADDISGAQIVLNASLQGPGACYLLFGRGNGLVSLASNDANSFTSSTLGSVTVLQNSQCSVDLSKSFEVQTGNTLNLTLAISFTPSFRGLLYAFSNVQNNVGAGSGYVVLGNFTVQPFGGVIYSNITTDTINPAGAFFDVGSSGFSDAFNFSPATGQNYVLQELDVSLLALTYLDPSAGRIARISLYSDSSGLPGTLIESFAVAVPSSDISTLPHGITKVLSVLHPTLIGGATYWLAVGPDANSVSDSWLVNNTNDFGVQDYRTSPGSPWQTSKPLTGLKGAFRLIGTLVTGL